MAASKKLMAVALTLQLALGLSLGACQAAGNSSTGSTVPASEPPAAAPTGDSTATTAAGTGTEGTAPEPSDAVATGVISTDIKQGNTRNLEFGGYKWRVLQVQSDQQRALLITEDVIERHPYNVEDVDVTWETCSLRRYLNGDFLDKLSAQEQEQVLEVSNTNANNQWYGTPGGNDTKDKVFLLSLDEVVKYFGDSGQLANKPADAADNWYINDQYDKNRVVLYEGTGIWWWLRSPGGHANLVATCEVGGGIYVNGGFADYYEGGVRPVLWLKL
ncbi:MAG: DUF6273 domain-containing protein [Actinomycetia bacterium]|nr:DUF6273 domain-containing protein [Actinomycetes bacterium]